MGLEHLAEKWCNLSPENTVTIITDGDRLGFAMKIRDHIPNPCHIINLWYEQDLEEHLSNLSLSDLVIVLISLHTFVDRGANKVFSPSSKPEGLKAKYAFIRLDIPEQSFIQGLRTPKALVYEKIREVQKFCLGNKVRVTTDAGTDVTVEVGRTSTCRHEIIEDGGSAFLPPSEIFSDVTHGTTNGRIVVDVTLGQLYHFGVLLGEYGIVDEPVVLDVIDGYVVSVAGGDMATDLSKKLFHLPQNCRAVVELGHGLSTMSPTGIIGVDESILGTCHFGIGDYVESGTHLDVVLKDPIFHQIQGAKAKERQKA